GDRRRSRRRGGEAGTAALPRGRAPAGPGGGARRGVHRAGPPGGARLSAVDTPPWGVLPIAEPPRAHGSIRLARTGTVEDTRPGSGVSSDSGNDHQEEG